MAKEFYDLTVVGSGPAGLTASIYASRYSLYNLVIGQEHGGTAMESVEVCNFPSQEKISGAKLMGRILSQAEDLGGEIVAGKVREIIPGDDFFRVSTGEEEYSSRAVLLATGTRPRRLGLPHEDKLIGRGVSYCVTCDGYFYKDKDVAVVGGADAANSAAVFLSDIARKVYQIYRRDELRGEEAWKRRVLSKSNIEVIYETEVTELLGDGQLEKVRINSPYKGSRELKVDGLFVEIGAVPENHLAKKLGVRLTGNGYIQVEGDQSTSVPGVWAAGDITTNSNGFRQIITACSEGAVAARSVFEAIRGK